MKVANYYRVSTKLQEKKFSLAAQKEELTVYADKQGWSLIAEFIDVDSGGKLSKSGLNNLLDLVEDGGIDVVLVVEQDRLSRLDTIAWEYLKSTLRDNEVMIAEPGVLTDLSNEDHEFISDLKNLIAKRQKKGIVRAMMRGKRQRLREGKGWGMPPFEYKYDRSTGLYHVKKGWEWTIPLLDELYLKEQLGMASISNRFNEVSKTPTGKKWNEHLIYTRLTSKAFHGVQEKDFITGETISQPKIYEPMRTEDTYNELQAERSKRGRQFSVSGRKSTDNVHMLKRTMLTCGECGRKIGVTQHGTKEKPHYYAKHGRKTTIKNSEVCTMNINSVRFDKNITNMLQDVIKGKGAASQYLSFDNSEGEIDSLKRAIRMTKNTINNLHESLDRLLDLYLSGDLKKAKYTEKENEIKSQITLHDKTLKQQELKLDAIDNKAWNYENMQQYIELIGSVDTELTNLERAQLFGDVFPKGTVYRDKVILVTEVYKGIPIEVAVKVDPDPYPNHSSKRQASTPL